MWYSFVFGVLCQRERTLGHRAGAAAINSLRDPDKGIGPIRAASPGRH